jgi:TRAP-type C4-dicarboxylate transport system substrate-binding protein
MQIDQLQGCILDGSGVESTVPNMGVMQLPFLFNDFDEVAYVKEKMRGELSRLFARKGYKVLMMPDQSFDAIFSTRGEIRIPEDFARSRFVALRCLRPLVRVQSP